MYYNVFYYQICKIKIKLIIKSNQTCSWTILPLMKMDFFTFKKILLNLRYFRVVSGLNGIFFSVLLKSLPWNVWGALIFISTLSISHLYTNGQINIPPISERRGKYMISISNLIEYFYVTIFLEFLENLKVPITLE